MDRVAHNTVTEIMEKQINTEIMENKVNTEIRVYQTDTEIVEEQTNTEIVENQTNREIVENQTNREIVENKSNSKIVEDKTGGEPKSKFTKAEKQLREFVVLMTTQVLKKCCALKESNMEMLLGHIQRLVNKTMEGFPVTESQLPDVSSKTVAKAVVTELRAKYGKKLKYMLLLQDLAVEAIVVECFQAHVRAAPGRTRRRSWKDVVDNMSFGASSGSLVV
ncbi:hypothetical protein F2P81_022967 [Scophthalmus maximus]|uniref:Uncharacterized protein n=1 Tax=Scophthalmus maximus TaxID=52904 RepID=A0A6A4RVC1_SCOMX|nr:hypothetical protein F2P81_022967 [Scophthalmus maximus]